MPLSYLRSKAIRASTEAILSRLVKKKLTCPTCDSEFRLSLHESDVVINELDDYIKELGLNKEYPPTAAEALACEMILPFCAKCRRIPIALLKKSFRDDTKDPDTVSDEPDEELMSDFRALRD